MAVVNLTPILEAIFGIGKMASREEVETLIEVLKSKPHADLFDAKQLADIQARFQAALKGGSVDLSGKTR